MQRPRPRPARKLLQLRFLAREFVISTQTKRVQLDKYERQQPRDRGDRSSPECFTINVYNTVFADPMNI